MFNQNLLRNPQFATNYNRFKSTRTRIWKAIINGLVILLIVVIASPFLLSITDRSIAPTVRSTLLTKENLPLLSLFIVDIVFYITVTILLLLQSFETIQKEKRNRRWDLLRLTSSNIHKIVLGKWWLNIRRHLHLLCLVTTLHGATAIYTLLLVSPSMVTEQQYPILWMFALLVIFASVLDLNLSILFGLCLACIPQNRWIAYIGIIFARVVTIGGMVTLLVLIILSLTASRSCMLLAGIGTVTYMTLTWSYLHYVDDILQI